MALRIMTLASSESYSRTISTARFLSQPSPAKNVSSSVKTSSVVVTMTARKKIIETQRQFEVRYSRIR